MKRITAWLEHAMNKHIKAALVAGAMVAVGCDSGSRSVAVPSLLAAPAQLGEARRLGPLPIAAPLPASAKVEDLSQPGMPHRVNVTSMAPELIFDLEEVDGLSPSHDEVLKLATSPFAPGERAVLRDDQRLNDGSFEVLVAHATSAPGVGRIERFTVDMRIRAGERLYDCSGTASTLEAAQHLVAACRAIRAV